MTDKKKVEIISNLIQIRNYLVSINSDKKKQALIDRLEQPERLIPEEIEDAAFNRTKEILKHSVPQCLSQEDRTPQKQDQLVRKLIKDCMTHLLWTARPESKTLFDTLPDAGPCEEIHQYANNHSIIQACKMTYRLFKPAITLQELLNAVIWSDAEGKSADTVENILRNHPDLLFKKGRITKQGITTEPGKTLYEQTYDDASAFQLILFTGDMYLLEQIKPFITEENREKAKAQRDELHGGGSDLVKLAHIKEGAHVKDISELSYHELTRFVEKDENGHVKTEADEHGVLREITYPLLQNKNGVVAYNDHHYYISLNHKTKTVEEIKPIYFETTCPQKQEQINQLIADFSRIEINSGQRSTNQQHDLIQKMTGIALERKGLRYKRGDHAYQNTQSESLIVVALRQYIRLWNAAREMDQNENGEHDAWLAAWRKADEAWLDVGKAQATDTADKLLLYCLSIPFSQMPDFKVILHPSTENQNRALTYDDMIGHHTLKTSIYGKAPRLLGGSFSLVKARYNVDGRWGVMLWGDSVSAPSPTDLNLGCLRRYEEVSRSVIHDFMESLDFPMKHHAERPSLLPQ